MVLRWFAGTGMSSTVNDARPDAKTAKVVLAPSLGVLGGSRSGPSCCNQLEHILGYAARRRTKA